jgi:hypothetical protein
MRKANTVVWLILVVLTLLGFYFSEGQSTGTVLAVSLMGMTILKFSGIGFQFIELRQAHVFWKIIYLLYILIFSILVVSFAG